MNNTEYKQIFKNSSNIKKNLIRIISCRKLSIKTKYYATVLCTNPTIFRWQRNFMIKMKIIKGDWV